MSQSLHYSLTTHANLLDVLDEAWRQDTLPDDGEGGQEGEHAMRFGRQSQRKRMLVARADIPLPEGLVPPLEETEDLREGLQSQEKHTAQWQELGLNTIH